MSSFFAHELHSFGSRYEKPAGSIWPGHWYWVPQLPPISSQSQSAASELQLRYSIAGELARLRNGLRLTNSPRLGRSNGASLAMKIGCKPQRSLTDPRSLHSDPVWHLRSLFVEDFDKYPWIKTYCVEYLLKLYVTSRLSNHLSQLFKLITVGLHSDQRFIRPSPKNWAQCIRS
jgi:hypothetical protein